VTVYLVGAGPGDPGLLTRRGAEVLASADVVLFDRLVDASLLDLAPSRALRIDVGKRPGETHHQEDVNALLMEHAQRGACVVRLKGGDPFVFGRGGEEAEALIAAGIAFEVIPGVSAAFAAPAAAGTPVTHRGLSSTVTVVTGHSREPAAPGAVDWEALGRAGGTLVVLMGMAHRADIARRLIAAGREPSTPVLVVRLGTTPHQAEVRTTLADLHTVELGPPSTIVIGEVAALDLRSPDLSPLAGWRVVITRPRHQNTDLGAALADLGATVVELPVIAIEDPADGGEALRAAAAHAREYDWIVFTSANAVDRFAAHVLRDGASEGGALGTARVAAVGGATAAAVGRLGVVAELVPNEATAAAVVDAMPAAPSAVAREDGTPGNRVLFPRAAGARDVLAPGLRAKGWDVVEVEAYRTVRASAADGVTEAALDAASCADAIVFASPSAVTAYGALSGERPVPPVVACVGPVTAGAARAAGFDVRVVADEHSAAGIATALAAYARAKPST